MADFEKGPVNGTIEQVGDRFDKNLNFELKIQQSYENTDPSVMVILDQDSRLIGNIPIVDNYEPTMAKPLDARTLVEKPEDLLKGSWWVTRFGVDTIIYKGMTVTCASTNMVYVYRGDTKVVNSDTVIPETDWRKQRLDESQLIWPLNFLDEKLNIGYRLEDSYIGQEGFVITPEVFDEKKKGTGKYGSIYMNNNFISFGTNYYDPMYKSTDVPIPFIPASHLSGWERHEDKNTYMQYRYAQTGIFIPTSTEHDKSEDYDLYEDALSIFSCRGEGIILETAYSDTDGAHPGGKFQMKSDGVSLDSSGYVNLTADDGDVSLRAYVGNINMVANVDISLYAELGNISLHTDVGEIDIVSKESLTLKTDASLMLDAKSLDIAVSSLYRIEIGQSLFEITDKNINLDSSDIKVLGKEINIGHILDTSAVTLNARRNINLNAPAGNVYANALGIFNSQSLTLLLTSSNSSYRFSGGYTGSKSIGGINTSLGSSLASISLTSTLSAIEFSGIEVSTNGTLKADTNIIDINTKSYELEAINSVNIKSDNSYIKLAAPRVDIGFDSNSSTNIRGDFWIYDLKFPRPSSNNKSSFLMLDSNGQMTWNNDIYNETFEIPTNKGSYLKLVTIWYKEKNSNSQVSADHSFILAISADLISSIYEVIITKSGIVNIHDVGTVSNDNNVSLSMCDDGRSIDVYIKVTPGLHLSWNIVTGSKMSDANIDIVNIGEAANAMENDISQKSKATVNWTRNVKYNESSGIQQITAEDQIAIPNPLKTADFSLGTTRFLSFRKTSSTSGDYQWNNMNNQMRDMSAVNDGTKIYLLGSEYPGARQSTIQEFFNSQSIYADQYQNIFATAFYAISDRNKKDDIKEIEYNDASILTPKSFIMKDSGKKSYGFIAQEVEEQGYSEIVNTDEDGTKTLNYTEAFSIVIAQMQEKIKQLEDEILQLKANR